ncbi:hypothetical protein D9M68_665760 [compost metagenome]
MVPLRPLTNLRLVMILMTPEAPSPSYLAPGLVSTSMLLILSAGIWRSTSFTEEAISSEGLPSISTLMLLLPLSCTLPSMSTVTIGTLRSTSVAEVPWLDLSFSTL